MNGVQSAAFIARVAIVTRGMTARNYPEWFVDHLNTR
jgi:hypothetical protein